MKAGKVTMTAVPAIYRDGVAPKRKNVKNTHIYSLHPLY